jgi:hypothetical protein
MSLHARLSTLAGGMLSAVFMSSHPRFSARPDLGQRVRVLQKPFEINEFIESLDAVLGGRV